MQCKATEAAMDLEWTCVEPSSFHIETLHSITKY